MMKGFRMGKTLHVGSVDEEVLRKELGKNRGVGLH